MKNNFHNKSKKLSYLNKYFFPILISFLFIFIVSGPKFVNGQASDTITCYSEDCTGHENPFTYTCPNTNSPGLYTATCGVGTSLCLDPANGGTYPVPDPQPYCYNPCTIDSFTCSDATSSSTNNLAWTTQGCSNVTVTNSLGGNVYTLTPPNQASKVNSTTSDSFNANVSPDTYTITASGLNGSSDGYSRYSTATCKSTPTLNAQFTNGNTVSGSAGQTLTIPFTFLNSGAKGSSVTVSSGGCTESTSSGVTVAPGGLVCPFVNPTILVNP